jgi:hypothetical protein
MSKIQRLRRRKPVELNLAFQRGFPVIADPVRFSAEAVFNYGLTDWWKLGLKANLDESANADFWSRRSVSKTHLIAELRNAGAKQTSAIMCAETLWWRCHRRIITDYLINAGKSGGDHAHDGDASAALRTWA